MKAAIDTAIETSGSILILASYFLAVRRERRLILSR
jgi:hypothetical protein